jgi:hypothetical protein
MATFAQTAAAARHYVAAARSLRSRPQPAARAGRARTFAGYKVRGSHCLGAKARASEASPSLARSATARRLRAPARSICPPFTILFKGGSWRASSILSAPLPGAAALGYFIGVRCAPAEILAPEGVAAPTLLPPTLFIASASLWRTLRGRQVSRRRHRPPLGGGGGRNSHRATGHSHYQKEHRADAWRKDWHCVPIRCGSGPKIDQILTGAESNVAVPQKIR